MIFRVLKAFKFRSSRLKVSEKLPGQLIDVPSQSEADRLLGAGFITLVKLPSVVGGKTYDAAKPLTRIMRVGIWLITSTNYSGGRIHMYQYAWCLANAGAEVFFVTNGFPCWAKDYPIQSRLHILAGRGAEPPEDLDLIVTDSKGDIGHEALDYKNSHPWIPFVCMNFETPNWILKFAPEKRGKVNLSKAVFERADQLLANSHESRKFLLQWLGKKTPCHVLQPAINDFGIRKSKLPGGFAPDRPFAVWAARAEGYKEGGTAIKSIFTLNTPFDLVMFGQPPKHLPRPNKLHRILDMRGKSDAIKFGLLKRAHLVLAPSRFEGFGMVPGESLASGTPVVAYDLPVLRQEYGPHPGLYLVKRGDRKAFMRKVADLAKQPKQILDGKPVLAKFGMEAMSRRVDKLPFHAMRRRRVTAQMIAYWGFLPEALEAIYPHVDEIIIAFGRAGQARKIDDGSLHEIKQFPDPDKKIRLEVREHWRDKRTMRNWCSAHTTGNYVILLDGDEIWTGLDKWLSSDIPFGTPRWVNLWHSGKHWIHDPPKGALRWGRKLGTVGSSCHHYRCSWWRKSFYFAKHHSPKDRNGNLLVRRSAHAAEKCPECVIYHLGHALPPAVMSAKHDFYLARDGEHQGHAVLELRKQEWHKWKPKKHCRDGVVDPVDWCLPDIVKRALRSASKLSVKAGMKSAKTAPAAVHAPVKTKPAVKAKPAVKLIVTMHFDSHTGMVYERGLDPSRVARTVSKPEWWARRADILRRFVLPSLDNQQHEDFDLWTMFRREDEQRAAPVLALLRERARTFTTFSGPEEIRRRYHGACDYLGIVFLDSDDMYSERALSIVSSLKPQPGLLAAFTHGYVYGLNDGKLGEHGGDKLPPPFYVTFYTRGSLLSPETWKAYRLKWALSQPHNKICNANRFRILPSGHYLYSVHDSNTTTSWTNPHTKKKIKRWITDEDEKRAILSKFALEI